MHNLYKHNGNEVLIKYDKTGDPKVYNNKTGELLFEFTNTTVRVKE